MELATRASKPIVIADTQEQSRRRRRFRHHRHAARAGPKRCHQGRDWRDRRSGVRESRSRGGTRRDHSGSRSAASPEFPATRRSSNICRRATFRRPVHRARTVFRGQQDESRPVGSLAHRRRPRGSSGHARRSSRIRRCSAMSASSRPSNPSWSIKARCISAPISKPIAEKLIICAAPGAMPPTLPHAWTRLRPGIRIKPNGPAFAPKTKSRSRSSAHLLQPG